MAVVDGMKRCPRCGETKPVQEWPKSRNSSDGLGSACNECGRKRSSAWAKANPERHALLKWHSQGIDIQDFSEYTALKEAYGGGCWVCGKTEEEEGQRLCLDHDHTTGKPRSVLCSYHNSLLGRCGDTLDGCILLSFSLLRFAVRIRTPLDENVSR